MLNDVPSTYFSHLDSNGHRRDRDQRPELSRCSVEFVAPGDYMVRTAAAFCLCHVVLLLLAAVAAFCLCRVVLLLLSFCVMLLLYVVCVVAVCCFFSPGAVLSLSLRLVMCVFCFCFWISCVLFIVIAIVITTI
jgi:hypothetical protein